MRHVRSTCMAPPRRPLPLTPTPPPPTHPHTHTPFTPLQWEELPTAPLRVVSDDGSGYSAGRVVQLRCYHKTVDMEVCGHTWSIDPAPLDGLSASFVPLTHARAHSVVSAEVVQRADAQAGTRGGLPTHAWQSQLRSTAGASHTPSRAALGLMQQAHSLFRHQAIRALWPLPRSGCSLCGDSISLFGVDGNFKVWARRPRGGDHFSMSGVDVPGGCMLNLDDVLQVYRDLPGLAKGVAQTADEGWTAAQIRAASNLQRIITGLIAAVCRHSCFVLAFPLRRGEELGNHVAAMLLAAKVRRECRVEGGGGRRRGDGTGGGEEGGKARVTRQSP